MADLPSDLLPADDELSPSDDLAAAAASVLDDDLPEEDVPAVTPFGTSWQFDWGKGRFVRAGTAPAEVRGRESLAQWLEMARRTARGAHDAFSEQFGMDGPEDWEGTVDVVEASSDYEEKLRDAWLPHDRIAAVQNYAATFLRDQQVINVTSLDVLTDEEDAIPVTGPAPFQPA